MLTFIAILFYKNPSKGIYGVFMARDLSSDFLTGSKKEETQLSTAEIVKRALVPRKLNPSERLSKLVKTHITKIEKQMENGDLPKPSPYFYTASVLSVLEERLRVSSSTITKNYEKHSVLAQLITFERATIKDCLNGGYAGGENSMTHKLYAQLKQNGTTFVKPSASAPSLKVA